MANKIFLIILKVCCSDFLNVSNALYLVWRVWLRNGWMEKWFCGVLMKRGLKKLLLKVGTKIRNGHCFVEGNYLDVF